MKQVGAVTQDEELSRLPQRLDPEPSPPGASWRLRVDDGVLVIATPDPALTAELPPGTRGPLQVEAEAGALELGRLLRRLWFVRKPLAPDEDEVPEFTLERAVWSGAVPLPSFLEGPQDERYYLHAGGVSDLDQYQVAAVLDLRQPFDLQVEHFRSQFRERHQRLLVAGDLVRVKPFRPTRTIEAMPLYLRLLDAEAAGIRGQARDAALHRLGYRRSRSALAKALGRATELLDPAGYLSLFG